jgi:hypothetical protein
VFWIDAVTVAAANPLRWWVWVSDPFSDDIALFLMFSFNDHIYHRICFCCLNAFSGCIRKCQGFCNGRPEEQYESVNENNDVDGEVDGEIHPII